MKGKKPYPFEFPFCMKGQEGFEKEIQNSDCIKCVKAWQLGSVDYFGTLQDPTLLFL